VSEAPGAASPYDAVPYESLPFAQTHPDRLATQARLMGLAPPALAGCRVLELGCAAGGNLIPMAVAMPEAQFVGVDLSAVQVREGQALIADLGLTNIVLHACSITDVDAGWGRFDYILCHGVYSWVPAAVQDKILAICAEQLSASGVAYVSYNTLPGWHMRGMVRELMRFHAQGFAEPGQRVAQARAIVDFLARWVPAQDNAYGLMLRSELEILGRAPDYYLLHEHLEDVNEALYFHQFAERAAAHGLQYLAEAELSTMLASNLPPEVGHTLAQISSDVIRQEQFMDFLRNRHFRQTLLVRGEQPVNRSITPDRLQALWIAAPLIPASAAPDIATRREEDFKSAQGGLLRTPNPVTKAALVLLARRWPAAIAFEDLLGEAQALSGGADHGPLTPRQVLASDLLQGHIAGLVELHAAPLACASVAGERPEASALVRRQAALGLPRVTSLRHEPLVVDDGMRQLLGLLDGTRDRQAIAQGLARTALASHSLEGLLAQAARAGVLVQG
jgi:methyltransferase-like protein/SAM-dependent methyltransferase